MLCNWRDEGRLGGCNEREREKVVHFVVQGKGLKRTAWIQHLHPSHFSYAYEGQRVQQILHVITIGHGPFSPSQQSRIGGSSPKEEIFNIKPRESNIEAFGAGQESKKAKVVREMGSFSGAPLKVKVIDFSGLDPSSPKSERWVAVRGEVMAALDLYGCFEAVADDWITTEQREVMFGGVMKEVFCLPLEAKMRDATASGKFFYDHHPLIKYETFGIREATTDEAVQRFGELLWPQGINPATYEVIFSFSKLLLKLDHTVRLMVLESLGVEKYTDSLTESTSYLLRLNKYGALSEGNKSGIPVHTDANMTTIVCQHEIEGLEIHAKNGQRFLPSRDSINFMIGDSFGAWTNGKLQPCLHGVMDVGENTRYSVVFGSHPRDGYIMRVPDELVSEEYPLQYKPYKYDEYIKYRFASNLGKQAERTLKVYCGVGMESKEKLEA